MRGRHRKTETQGHGVGVQKERKRRHKDRQTAVPRDTDELGGGGDRPSRGEEIQRQIKRWRERQLRPMDTHPRRKQRHREPSFRTPSSPPLSEGTDPCRESRMRKEGERWRDKRRAVDRGETEAESV